jgi:hypothetical protein
MPIRVIAAILFAISISGCSVFVAAPEKVETGRNVVCILYNETIFKTEVVKTVSAYLESSGYRVVTDRTKRAKFYPAAKFGAVVYMAEYWMWHVPFHQKSYYADNDKASNIVFVTTAGDPDVRITRPFDAITSVSKKSEVGRVSKDILSRMEPMLKK